MEKINKSWFASLLVILATIVFGVNVYSKVIIDNVVEIESLYSFPEYREPKSSEPGIVEVPIFKVPSSTEAGIRYNHTMPAGTYRLEIYSPKNLSENAYYPNYVWRTAEINRPDCCWYGGRVCVINKNELIVRGDAHGTTDVPINVAYQFPNFAGPSSAYPVGKKIAADAARGSFYDIELNTGDYFILVMYDNKGKYTPQNSGNVTFKIYPILDYIKVFPDPAYVCINGEQQFVVKGYGFGENGEKDGDPDPETYAPAGDDTGPEDIEVTWAATVPENVGSIDGNTGLFQAGAKTGNGKVNAAYCGLTDEVDVAVYEIGIEEIWSDQFSGVKANYLPGGSGKREYDYILMGSRSDGKGYAKAKLKIEPDVDFVRNKVLVRLARNTTPEGEGTVAENVASMWIDSIHPDDYTVVAGLDINNNGRLDGDEICATTDHKLKITSQSRYNGGKRGLFALAHTWGRLAPTARRFLLCFLTDCRRLKGAIPRDITIAIDEPYHNVGVVFTTSGKGKAREYLFLPGDRLSRKIMRGKDLARWIRMDLFRYRMQVQNYEWKPKEKFHTFTWDLPSSGTAFGEFPDYDLGVAFGDVILKGKMDARVRRKDLKLVQLKVRGKLLDLYNWDYGEGGNDVKAARVQAGYNTLGRSGHIYKVRVYLRGRVKLHYSFK